MFPGFWYAGQPIGLGIGPIFAAIWKFFAASVLAGLGTALIIRVLPDFAAGTGASDAFVQNGCPILLIFFALYIVGVIALQPGAKAHH